MLKQVLCLFFFIALPVLLFAQQPDSVLINKTQRDSFHKHDTVLIKKKANSFLVKKVDSVLNSKADSVVTNKDTVKISSISLYKIAIQNIIKDNKFLNASGKPWAMIIKPRKQTVQDSIFYTIFTVIALLAFFRFFYVRYFNNLFRVFFNTSLRQGQLTDQLLQAKLPSLVFNIISVISGGLLIYFLLNYFERVPETEPLTLISICSLFVAAIYLLKFLSLKFTGWITDYKEITNTYIFIIFLINKILGILLLPFIVVMAFSVPVLIKVSALIAVLLTALMFLLRFFRSYSLLQHQLKISKPHFFMYIIGIEIVPVLLIYKGLMILLSKNL